MLYILTQDTQVHFDATHCCALYIVALLSTAPKYELLLNATLINHYFYQYWSRHDIWERVW